MGLGESIRLALEGLRANKMRSLLNMLGIIIGIGAVIGILTVGNGLTGSITGSMSSLGASNITVSLRAKESGEPQKYRYAVAAYNLLGHEAFSTEYTEFEINKAYFPEIDRISPELIYLDTLYDASIRVTGENLRQNIFIKEFFVRFLKTFNRFF